MSSFPIHNNPFEVLLDRFLDKIQFEPNTGCWLWVGCQSTIGYGRFWSGSRVSFAHRVSYEACRGKIPEDLQIDHLCRVRCCVNPDHLEPVTLVENTSRGRNWNRDKTHCVNGHPFDEENTVFYVRGKRSCRECKRASCRKYQAKMKEIGGGKAND